MIEMNCPHCGHQLRVRSKYAGRQGQCRHCQGFVDVPNTYADILDEPERGPSDVSTVSPQLAASTALADLMADDEPEPVAPTLPMPADAMASLLDEPPPQFYAPLGGYYWLLAVIVAPAALVRGFLLPNAHPQKKQAIIVPLVSLISVLFLLGIAIVVRPSIEWPTFRGDNRTDATSAVPVATTPPAMLPEAITSSTNAGKAYAQTRLPSYPGLLFSVVDQSENELSGPLATAAPSALTTFEGYVEKDFESITLYFFQELQNRGWAISDYDYGDKTKGETYIIGSKDTIGIVYRTREVDARTRVVITHGPLPEGP